MQKITIDWLAEKNACIAGIERWRNAGSPSTVKECFEAAIEDRLRYSDARWVIGKTFDKMQSVDLAVFAAKLVIDIYEKKYPDNKAPREAIEAAKAYLKEPSTSADAAAYAADAAADAAAYAAADAAVYAAAYAARAAAYAARAAAYAAYRADAAYAAVYASYGADFASAADAAKTEIRNKILTKAIEIYTR